MLITINMVDVNNHIPSADLTRSGVANETVWCSPTNFRLLAPQTSSVQIWQSLNLSPASPAQSSSSPFLPFPLHHLAGCRPASSAILITRFSFIMTGCNTALHMTSIPQWDGFFNTVPVDTLGRLLHLLEVLEHQPIASAPSTGLVEGVATVPMTSQWHGMES